MNENEYLANMICEHLVSGSAVVLASIISSKGSSPRHGGTRMVIAANGKGYGTIGGGKLEAIVRSESKIAFSRQASRFVTFEMLGDSALSQDPICGGKATLLLDLIPPVQKNVDFFRRFQSDIAKGNDFHFLTLLKESGSEVDIVGHYLMTRDGEVFGSFTWSNQDIETVKLELHNISSTTVIPIGDLTGVIDPIYRVKTMYCFGAGHIASPTAHIAALAGFRVMIVDDIAEFANEERFPDAGGIFIIKDFSRALEGLNIDNDSFIVLLTRGHQTDRAVLEQALKTDAAYIGMIASKRNGTQSIPHYCPRE